MKNAEKSCLAALEIYPDYLDSTSLLTSIYFVNKDYDKCYQYSTRFFVIAKMLREDKSKALIIPMSSMKNEWMINTQLAINFYEQAKEEEAVFFVGRAEANLPPDQQYKPSYTILTYFHKRGSKESLTNAEYIYKNGFRRAPDLCENP